MEGHNKEHSNSLYSDPNQLGGSNETFFEDLGFDTSC